MNNISFIEIGDKKKNNIIIEIENKLHSTALN